MFFKKGISLVVLTITVIVVIILVGATITLSSNSTNTAQVTMFRSELTDLESRIQEYYILNKELPSIDGEPVLGRTEVANLNSNRIELDNEILLNGDSTSEFYKLDLNKLDVEAGNRGFNNFDKDIFVFSFPSFKVYYIAGIFANDSYYFSISEQMEGVSLGDTTFTENTTLATTTSSGIKVEYTKGYTNELNAKITTEMDSDELIYLSVCGGSEYLITTNLGRNIFEFNSITEIYDNTSNMSAAGFDISEVIKIDGTKVGNDYTTTGREVDRYIEIIKKLSGSEVGRVKLDLNNYCNIGPTTTNDVITTGDPNNTVTLDIVEGDAPVQEVRYEYLKKYENSVVEDYYDSITSIDTEYLFAKGKKAIISGSDINITLPNYIERIQYIIVDKAGNYSKYEQVTANSAP